MQGGKARDLVVDIDIGGTFTDAIVSLRNQARFYKVDTTPHDLSHCLQNIFQKAAIPFDFPDLHGLLRRAQVYEDGYSFAVDADPFMIPAGEGPFAEYEEFGIEDPRICQIDNDFFIRSGRSAFA